MSCVTPDSKPDWKAYAMGELMTAERRQAEAHASGCGACRSELASIRLTLDALSTLREEEVPRRIAFVSDKVFAPKWWQGFLNPNFAAACVVAIAILVHAFVSMRASSNVEIQKAQIDAAVAKAVADVEIRNANAYDIIQKQFQQIYKQTSGIVQQ